MITSDQLNQLKFPIGPFTVQENISKTDLDGFIKTITSAPANYRNITKDLVKSDLKKNIVKEAGTCNNSLIMWRISNWFIFSA